ncbi:hypothetical protein [Flavobacterium sp. N1994]|uniref:hypothetical protein n=1 Tax=Flavobacterium sp. N1994 TaxID=2986827 RepID=UPI002223367E|nr:hypothetical protein [Flavobacterium sp. N1994]
MRQFNDIQQQIIDQIAISSDINALEVLTTSEQTLTSATSTSKVSTWRIFVWVVAFAIWLHEKIVSANAANSRPQNLPNFIATVLNFHDGLPLVWKDGQFQYDLVGISNPDSYKIINRCAVLESVDGELVVKVAHDNSGDLEPISAPQAVRLGFYLNQMKVPGVAIRLINETADLLKATLDVYVDPQMIDLDTGRLLNTTEVVMPAEVAIKEYLNNLEFNGAFVTDFLKSKMVAKDGIKLVRVNVLQWKYAAFPFTDFEDFKIPQSGYFKFDPADLTINYLPYALVNN